MKLEEIWKPAAEERRLMDDLARDRNLRVQNFQSRIFSEQVPSHLISKVCNLLFFSAFANKTLLSDSRFRLLNHSTTHFFCISNICLASLNTITFV